MSTNPTITSRPGTRSWARQVLAAEGVSVHDPIVDIVDTLLDAANEAGLGDDALEVAENLALEVVA